MSQQDEPDRHLWILRIATRMAFVAVLWLEDLIRLGVRAADLPCRRSAMHGGKCASP
jgi:hypothetical protein